MNGFPANLVSGFHQFRSNRYANEQTLYQELAEHGQKPEVMVVACCDSRTSPDVVFNTSPGEMFVVRNVANLVQPHDPDGPCQGVSAALEFAVLVLEVRHVVVLGHSGCGGIQACLSPAGPLSPANFVGQWMQPVRPMAQTVIANTRCSEDERQTALEQASVRQSVENLRSFPFVADREHRKQLGLHGAWFDIAEGDLWALDPEAGEFRQVQPPAIDNR